MVMAYLYISVIKFQSCWMKVNFNILIFLGFPNIIFYFLVNSEKGVLPLEMEQIKIILTLGKIA